MVPSLTPSKSATGIFFRNLRTYLVFLDDITRAPRSTLSRSFRQSNRNSKGSEKRGGVNDFGVRRAWSLSILNFQRQGEVKVFTLPVVKYGYGMEVCLVTKCMYSAKIRICFTIGVAYKTFFSLNCVIIQVTVFQKRTAVGDWCFDNLSGNHLQSQMHRVCQTMVS